MPKDVTNQPVDAHFVRPAGRLTLFSFFNQVRPHLAELGDEPVEVVQSIKQLKGTLPDDQNLN